MKRISIRHGLEEYLELRHGLGYDLEEVGSLLRQFVALMNREGACHITRDLAVRWAKEPTGVEPARWAKRLGMLREFAKYWSAIDPRTEIPPMGLLPHRWQRKPPHIYSDDEITRLLVAARRIPSSRGLRSWTYFTLLGLLAVSGMRVSEALALDDADVDLPQGVLTIRRTKFRKSRLVPVHETTRQALRSYVVKRNRVLPKLKTASFFVTERRGTRIHENTVRGVFIELLSQIGLKVDHNRRRPRLHDMRHRFAVNTLVRWYRSEGWTPSSGPRKGLRKRELCSGSGCFCI